MKVFITFIAVLIYSIYLSSFPFGEGHDRESYVSIFEKINTFSDFVDLRYEPFFSFIVLCSKKISSQPHFIFFSILLISTSLKTFAIKKGNFNSLVVIVLYYSIFGALYDYNQIRAGLGVSLMYIALSLENRNPYISKFAATVAFFSHYSTIIFTPLWVRWRRMYFLGFLALIGLYFLLNEYFLDVVFGYGILNYENQQYIENFKLSLFSPFIVICQIILIIILLFSKELKLKIFFLLIYLIFIYMKLNQIPYSFRVLETAYSITPLIVGNIYKYNPKSRRLIFTLCLVCMCYSPFYWEENSSV